MEFFSTFVEMKSSPNSKPISKNPSSWGVFYKQTMRTAHTLLCPVHVNDNTPIYLLKLLYNYIIPKFRYMLSSLYCIFENVFLVVTCIW